MLTWVYICVVVILLCPNKFWMYLISTSSSSNNVAKVWRKVQVIFRNAIKNRMTIIKRKTFIIKHFARFAEQTDLQKKTKYCDVSVTRLLAACFGNDGR